MVLSRVQFPIQIVIKLDENGFVTAWRTQIRRLMDDTVIEKENSPPPDQITLTQLKTFVANL